MRNSKGLHQVALLLREPGREFHALDLFEPNLAAHRIPATADPPWLDSRARSEYGQRLAELRAQLHECERLEDANGATAVSEEISSLATELSRHFGLGGRDRPGRTDAERARVNLTRTIRGTIGKLELELPELARLLKRVIRTGLFSRYEPDPDFPLDIEV